MFISKQELEALRELNKLSAEQIETLEQMRTLQKTLEANLRTQIQGLLDLIQQHIVCFDALLTFFEALKNQVDPGLIQRVIEDLRELTTNTKSFLEGVKN